MSPFSVHLNPLGPKARYFSSLLRDGAQGRYVFRLCGRGGRDFASRLRGGIHDHVWNDNPSWRSRATGKVSGFPDFRFWNFESQHDPVILLT